MEQYIVTAWGRKGVDPNGPDYDVSDWRVFTGVDARVAAMATHKKWAGLFANVFVRQCGDVIESTR